MQKSYKLAFICGFAPLILGILIFLLWLCTRWDWLMIAGLFNIYAGIAFILTGCVALCWYAFREKLDPQERKLFRRGVLTCLLLYVTDFVLCASIVFASVSILTCYTVVVRNDSPQVLEDVRVFGGGCDKSFGSIAVGAQASRYFWFTQDGSLDFQAKSNKRNYQYPCDTYVTHNLGGAMEIIIGLNEEISAIEERTD